MTSAMYIICFSCLCHSGYTGEYCDEVFDPCEEIHCLNGGNCTTQNNKFICECTPEFIGSRCQTLVSIFYKVYEKYRNL